MSNLWTIIKCCHIKSYVPVLLLAIGLSVISTWYFMDQGLVTNYNDARAHLNLARLVFDNQKPGLAQLGGVWLPLQHWLMLPFVWSWVWWQNGLAGSIVSMVSYIVAGTAVYALGELVTGKRSIGLMATLVFLLNVNVWYMQSVPMSELLLLMFFVLTTYCLVRWVMMRDPWWLTATALACVGATLTRYDGWFMLLWVTGVVVAVEWSWVKQRTTSIEQAGALLLMFLALAFVGVVFWLGWNWVIYSDPLFFAYGPYSAKAQQAVIAASGKLYTVQNLPLSLRAYGWATFNNVGLVGTGLLLSGLIVWPGSWPRKEWKILLPLTVLLSPFFFHVLALYRGQSILMVPELGLFDPERPASAWFNVRYGLVMLPAAAIWGTYFLRKKIWQVMLVLLLIGQASYSLATHDIVTLTDATKGTSALVVDQEAKWLATHIKEGELVMASLAFHNAFAYETGVPMKQFIHEGTDDIWRVALADPAALAEWVIMMKGDLGDPLYDGFIKSGNEQFRQNYRIAYRGDFLNIYRRSNFVVRDGSTLYYKGQPLRFVGVNSYDLLYQEPAIMRETMRQARIYGFPVIRFWAFGEGFPGAMQPQAGVLDEDVATRLDVLLSIARDENVRLVPVLGNYWADYGGVGVYLSWLGKPQTRLSEQDVFFASPEARALYWNYVEKIVNRRSGVTGIRYKDDPTILAWELMNEPRTADRMDQELVRAWVDQLGEYIHGLDNNHLVISGVEGFMNDVYPDVSGPDHIVGNSSKYVDIASGHLYQKYLAEPTDNRNLRRVIAAWADNAQAMTKPLFVGEIGFPRDKVGGRERGVGLIDVLEEAQEDNVSGLFIWNWALYAGEPHNISPLVAEDRLVLQKIRPLVPVVEFAAETVTEK